MSLLDPIRHGPTLEQIQKYTVPVLIGLTCVFFFLMAGFAYRLGQDRAGNQVVCPTPPACPACDDKCQCPACPELRLIQRALFSVLVTSTEPGHTEVMSCTRLEFSPEAAAKGCREDYIKQYPGIQGITTSTRQITDDVLKDWAKDHVTCDPEN